MDNNHFYKRAAGLFYSRDEAEAAVHALKDTGYDMDRVSVIARDADNIGGYEIPRKSATKLMKVLQRVL